MPVSDLFLKKLGVTRAKFVTWSRTVHEFDGPKTDVGLKLNEFANFDFANFDSDSSNYMECRTCCGVAELTNITSRYIFRAVCQALFSANCVVYYGTNRRLIPRLRALGFTERGTFYNPNSGNTVYIMILTV